MKKTPVRVPTAKPTSWHKDKTQYNRTDERRKVRKQIERERR